MSERAVSRSLAQLVCQSFALRDQAELIGVVMLACLLMADPFADAGTDDTSAGGKEYVHIRIQQRNGRKSLTTVQGIPSKFGYNKILKELKKEFCCNGSVAEDIELGKVIQLQGDQRKNVATFLADVMMFLY